MLNVLIQSIGVLSQFIAPKKKRRDYSTISKIMVLASQLVKHTDLSRSSCMKFATAQIKNNPEAYKLVSFTKVSGKPCKRVVMSDSYENYYTSKGTGRKPKEGQVLFADAARVLSGQKSVIISTYYDRIENFF